MFTSSGAKLFPGMGVDTVGKGVDTGLDLWVVLPCKLVFKHREVTRDVQIYHVNCPLQELKYPTLGNGTSSTQKCRLKPGRCDRSNCQP